MRSRRKRAAATPLSARCHMPSACFWCSASASGADVIMATPTRTLGSSPRRNGLSARSWRSGWRKIWKLVCGQRLGHDADLHADRFVLHDAGEVLDLGARQRAAFALGLLRKIETADETVDQEARDLGGRDQIDDRGLAPAIGFLAALEHGEDLVDIGFGTRAIAGAFGDALLQELAQGRVERVRREQIGHGPRQHDDVLGGLLDLAHALEIGDGGGDVLDADAEQRRQRDVEQLGEFFERVDLDQLAFLEAVERGARDADAVRDFLGGESGAEPERLQPVADIVKARRHG